MSYRGEQDGKKLYVGGLGDSTQKPDLEKVFEDFGPLKSVWIARNPPGFAFVEFEDDRDAEDAVKGVDGKKFHGNSLRVEVARGRSRGGRGGRWGQQGGSRYGGGGGGGYRDRGFGGGRGSYGGRDNYGSRDNYRQNDRARSPRRHRSKSRSRSRSTSPV